MYIAVLSALLLATVTDLRKREIPDWISIALLGSAVGAQWTGHHPGTPLDMVSGAVAAFVPCAILFALGGFGGGDVKLMTASGA